MIKCPHCLKTLERIKEREDFYVQNNDCVYYQQKLSKMTKEEKNHFKQDPQAFKVRYIFREFHPDFDPISTESPVKPKVDLSRIYASPHTFSLIM